MRVKLYVNSVDFLLMIVRYIVYLRNDHYYPRVLLSQYYLQIWKQYQCVIRSFNALFWYPYRQNTKMCGKNVAPAENTERNNNSHRGLSLAWVGRYLQVRVVKSMVVRYRTTIFIYRKQKTPSDIFKSHKNSGTRVGSVRLQRAVR